MVAADTVGRLAASIRLPTIVGYLAAGVIFGPSVLGTLSEDASRQLAPVSSLAIALIAFLAGAELRWSELRQRGVLILKILASEMTLTLVAVTAVIIALRSRIPFLANTVHVSRFSRCSGDCRAFAGSDVALLSRPRHADHGRPTLGVVLVSTSP